MTITFTNLDINLTVNYTLVDKLLAIMSEMQQAGAGNLLRFEMQFHVTGNNADRVKVYLQELHTLGAIENYQYQVLVNQVDSLKRHYLK